jgi:hypothetical protein
LGLVEIRRLSHRLLIMNRETMRGTLLLSLGAIFFLVLASLGTHQPAGAIAAAESNAPKESYVKVRVDVEARGTLRMTDKGATIKARDRVYDLFNDQKEITDRVLMTDYALDFKRSPKLLERATDLNGLEVEVTGLSELRMVNTTAGVGAMSRPTWNLQRSILVTGLKPVD